MKKIISCLVSVSMLASLGTGFAVTTAQAAAKEPTYQANARQMEELNRGLIAAYRTVDNRSIMSGEGGVFLSWRLLGTESLTDQAFDIYRGSSATGSFTKINTTGAHDATNYIDTNGTASNYYKVVRAGESAADEPAVKASGINNTPKGSEVGEGNSLPGSYTYVDIPIDRPDPVQRMGDGKTSYYYNTSDGKEGGANDASVGDLDGDGDYELVLKWDPTDSKDSAGADFTGNCYIDAYEIDPNAQKVDGKYRKWRIDLGKNVTSGAHYTQFIVYDFDGDGKAEVAMKTAPGTIDGTGKYVTEVGDTDAIRNTDNTKSYIGTSGRLKGKNPFTQFLTVFDGETGEALATTEYIPYEMHSKSYWGDGSAKYNRSERYLAAVAYIDGVHPSIVMCRGYYDDAVVRTYIWDGSELTLQWEHDGAKKSKTSIYGQGNHNLSVADIDNDGRDEIVYGSVALDDNGVAMGNTYLGHGDAMHVNDFNNDGIQEVFSVKEDSVGYKSNAANFRVAASGEILWGKGASGDTGRGVMANIDDEYAKTHSNALALGWTSSHTNVFDLTGAVLNAKPSKAGSGSFDNSLVFWDGDLSRELLDANIIQKYDAANGWSKRFYGPSDGYTLSGGSTNNSTKRNATLSADLWGDWREEVILPINKGDTSKQAYLRIFTSTMPTNYRLTTLMHDSQYRCAIAWQNVGYNQPPHTSYYIGSAALATDANGNPLNYLAPAVPFTNVTYDRPQKVAVTGITLAQSELSVEKGRTGSVTANIEPSNASKKGITWTSSNPAVATVTRGVVTGIEPGTATITAKTNDGGFEAICTVTVWSNPVTGITVSDAELSVGSFLSKKITAAVEPANASDQSYTWSSLNPSVATVDENGLVYGASIGEADIVATSVEGGFTATCHVKVVPMQTVDVTGSDVFKTDNTDAATKLSGATALGGTLTQTDATEGGNMYKTFEAVSENKAELTFRFTTGGLKYDNSNWNWAGHEYSLNVELLGEDDQNILKLTQPYAASPDGSSTGAGALLSSIGSSDAEAFSSSWTTVVDGLGNIQGSFKRWIVDVVFDYENDSATATITGTDSSWEAVSGQYTKEFDLNGLSLEKLRVSTVKDGTGTIKCVPVIANTSYVKQTEIEGTHNSVYERGTNAETAWKASDVDDWTHTGTLNYSGTDAQYGRIFYNPTKPGTEYSATKTFTLDPNDEMVTYDVDWYFGNAVNRDSNAEYIQFGDKLRLEWTNEYKLYVSVDGGESHITEPIFTGSNTAFTKHVQVVFDPAMTSIKSLRFDGEEIKAVKDYWFRGKSAVDSVSFGFKRGGATDGWEYPTGLDSIRVTEFIGNDTPERVTPTPAATPTPSPTPTAAPTPTPTPDPNQIASNSFDGSAGTIISIATTDTPPYTGIDGMTMYIGTRSGGADASTNLAIEAGGRSGNALVLNSGKFASSNRGPRFAINTPELSGDYSLYAEFYAKPVEGTTDPKDPGLFYGDSTSAIGTNMNLAVGEWSKISVSITSTGGTVERIISVNDTPVKTDSTATFPVFWGTGSTNYSKVFIDDFNVTKEGGEPAVEPTATPEALETPMPTAAPDPVTAEPVAKAAVNVVNDELRISDKTAGAVYRFDLSDYSEIKSAKLIIKVAPRSYKEADHRFENTEIWTYKVNSDWNSTENMITGEDWNKLSKGDPINKQYSEKFPTADPNAVPPYQTLEPVDVTSLIGENGIAVFAFKTSTAREHAIDAVLEIVGTRADAPTGVTAEAFEVTDNTAAATVTNNTAETVTIQLFAAVYNTDGTLESVRLATKEIAAGGTESIEAANDTAGTLKAFLWKDQEPISEAK